MHQSIARCRYTLFPVVLVSIVLWFPNMIVAADLPASVAALAPASSRIDGQDWGVFETEFGKTFSADIRALFPNDYPSCAESIYKTQLTARLRGDTAWEAPPMLDMAKDIYNSEVNHTRESMRKSFTTSVQNLGNVSSIGELQEEQLGNGQIFYLEFVENCSKNPHSAKTILNGYAMRGATMLDFHIDLSAEGAVARSIAIEILDQFEKLDIAALTE